MLSPSVPQIKINRIAALAAFARRDHPHVKLLIAGGVTERILAAEAARRALGGEYEFGGSPARIRWMRSVAARLSWQRCYRTCEAPALGPSAEYAR